MTSEGNYPPGVTEKDIDPDPIPDSDSPESDHECAKCGAFIGGNYHWFFVMGKLYCKSCGPTAVAALTKP